MQAHNHKNCSVYSIKTGQKQVPHVISESDMLNALMFCCLLLVNKDLLQRSTAAITRWKLEPGARGGSPNSFSRQPRTHHHSRQELRRFLLLFLLPSFHTTRRLFVFAWPQIRADLPETTDQHSASSRSPALRIRVQIHQNPRHSDHAGSLCIRPAALNDSQFRTLPSCSPFVYCKDLVDTNSPTTEQLHVAD